MKKLMWVLVLGIMTVLLYLFGNKWIEVASVGSGIENEVDIVIDPGHGGDDPGKIGINDAKEKDINLAIGLKVKSLLEEQGYKVAMTRTNDDSNGLSKVEDLQSRVDAINICNPQIAVSIHQNSYEEEAISGAQVFYYTHSQEGEKAAVIMQESLLRVDEVNHRMAKANDTYYLLEKTEIPTIIVECGFLSNWEEADCLVKEEYQDQLAVAIVDGIECYIKK